MNKDVNLCSNIEVLLTGFRGMLHREHLFKDGAIWSILECILA